MRGGIIYLITNTVNGKQYVGQTVESLNNRWAKHVYSAQKGGRKHAISCAIRKYGRSAFTVEAIARLCDRAGLNGAEEAFISALNTPAPNGYNLAAGGDCAPMPESSRKKISRAVKKQWLNPEHRARVRAAALKQWQNPEHRAKVAAANTGKKHSPESRMKMRLAKLGRRKARQCQTSQI